MDIKEKIIKLFYKFYWRARDIIIPQLKSSQYYYKDILKTYVVDNSRWLDLGCGHQILPEWTAALESEQMTIVKHSKMIVGIDYDLLSLKQNKYIKYKVVGNIHSLPFKDVSFNIATANMVVEHIENPNIFLAEIHRILKPNGLFLFHTPNLLNYRNKFAFLLPDRFKKELIKFLEDRKEKDIFPTYYRINTPRAIRNLSEVNGFNVLQLNLIDSDSEVVMLCPLFVIELLIIKICRLRLFANLRSNIIAVLKKIK